ncbi:hypothetical protein CA834_00930 [Winogradskyella aurantia]|uniref:TonB-dependent receptor plug domain-containing protein n=1 Tax=Winogradskyella aurantia TaxID=1915063 RepID=A0A265UZF8_9FLAO|nr:hypothetical protein CA834_00930 [Winogradskyella aurantia]
MFFCSVIAQTPNTIIEHFENYVEAPREVAYVHLNKSSYIKGEMMGFTAYIFDKSTKATSQLTTNLYCTITDENNTPIKEALIRVDEGIASNVFNIDSSFTSGRYTFKAYTNWMRNFKEPNHFEASFRVIQANDSTIQTKLNGSSDIDLQVLGEGGHILYNVNNTIGIIAKNKFGYGVKGASGTIRDEKDNIITEFKLNEVGLAKALFNPKPSANYKAVLDIDGQLTVKSIENIKLTGINMSMAPLSEKVNILFSTNERSIKQLANKTFKIAHHNGVEIYIVEFKLNSEGKALVSFPKESLFKGINIFTVLDEKNRPTLERLLFNKNGIKHHKASSVESLKDKDSLRVKIEFNLNDKVEWSNLSVSTLPTGTKSYDHNSSLLSQLYIRPYINGYLENGQDYFKDNNRITAYNLDLLMLTQGWSSYSWGNIFNTDKTVLKYPFENGIDITAKINKNQSGTYVLYPFENDNTQLFDVPEGKDAFQLKSNFPMEDDFLRVSYIGPGEKNSYKAPKLYLTFSPNIFPSFDLSYNSLAKVYLKETQNISAVKIPEAWKKVEQLEEVIVKSKKNKSRAETLKNNVVNSRIAILNDNVANLRIDLYIQRLGFITNYNYFTGGLTITNPRVNWGNPVPAVYLDDVLVGGYGQNATFDILTTLTTKDVDYIEYELYGIGGGINGGAGFIKIYTIPRDNNKGANKSLSTYLVPLRFSSNKSFYTPKYTNFDNQFFEDYAAIDWHPNLKLDDSGAVFLTIDNSRTDDITLFIEGVINEDEYISQKIELNKY